jgi:hypothetical protein
MEQDVQLVISDPKACNNIVIKDQTIFEETQAFLEYVYSFQSSMTFDTLPYRTNNSIFGPGLLSTLGEYLSLWTMYILERRPTFR